MVFVDKQVSGPTRRGGYDEIEMTDKILDRRGVARRGGGIAHCPAVES